MGTVVETVGVCLNRHTNSTRSFGTNHVLVVVLLV
jgi:hypothetical protein